MKKCSNCKKEVYYNALIHSTEKTVEECRIEKVGDNMTTTKTRKTCLNFFDDERFYVSSI